MRRAIFDVVIAIGFVTGCASSQPQLLISDSLAASAYRGPLHVPVSHADDASVLERSGAAGRALECDYPPYEGGSGVYDDGLLTVQPRFRGALAEFLGGDGWRGGLPSRGYRVERTEDERVLVSWDVRGRTKVAIVLRDGIEDYEHHRGWGVETFAECDPAEFPPDRAEALGVGVWQDRSGARVPITRIQSFQGAAHCDWENITFLLLGPESSQREYVRDTAGELAPYLGTTYDSHAHLPRGATDTGYRRDGRQLWLGPSDEAAYLVSLQDPDDVERWPLATQPIRCA